MQAVDSGHPHWAPGARVLLAGVLAEIGHAQSAATQLDR